jgi:hypothetical protein
MDACAANGGNEPFFYHPNPKLSLCLELPLSLQNQANIATKPSQVADTQGCPMLLFQI